MKQFLSVPVIALGVLLSVFGLWMLIQGLNLGIENAFRPPPSVTLLLQLQLGTWQGGWDLSPFACIVFGTGLLGFGVPIIRDGHHWLKEQDAQTIR